MNLKSLTGPGRSSRRRQNVSLPVAAESCEQRSLLTTPVILTPTEGAEFSTARPEITWSEVEGALSYDVWITDADSRTIVLVQSNIEGTSFVPPVDLNQGRIRVWVRANLIEGPAADWSAPRHFVIQTVPALTGPVNLALPGSPQKINDVSPTVTWDAAPGSSSFELWFENRATGTYQTFNIENLTPVLDETGEPVLDSNGDVIRQEIRSFDFPSELPMGSYRIWMRSTDDAGRVTRWSAPLSFEVAPQVNILRPTAPTLQNPPLLEWAPVPGATQYDLWVDGEGKTQLYRWGGLKTTSFQVPRALDGGTYRFWVRAILKTTGKPDVNGIWSNAAEFSKATRPVITGPLGTDGFVPGVPTVTDIRPTLEWTRIDKAARYDVWVDKGFGPAGFIRDTSSVNSYTLTQDIAPGRYTAWVRALSANGTATPWSPAFEFYATGGSPVILSPVDGSEVSSEPTFTWTPVGNAASYELWIAYVGVDDDYYVQHDIPEATHTVQTVLPSGTYRVWVRAILADGTSQNWSSGITVTVAEIDRMTPSDILLTSLLNPQNSMVEDLVKGQSTNAGQQVELEFRITDEAALVEDEAHPSQQYAAPSVWMDSEVTATPDDTSSSLKPQDGLADTLNQLAEGCVRSEWWVASADN